MLTSMTVGGMTMDLGGVPPTRGGESLKAIAKRLREMLKLSDSLVVEVAIEVIRLAGSWEQYRADANGLEIGPWLKTAIHASRDLSWYRMVAEAFGRRGKSFAGRVSCSALVWADRKVTNPADFRNLERDVNAKYRQQGSMLLTLEQVKRIGAAYVAQGPDAGISVRAELRAARERIARLEAQVRGLGFEPCE
jgi:hypothetical protein